MVLISATSSPFSSFLSQIILFWPFVFPPGICQQGDVTGFRKCWWQALSWLETILYSTYYVPDSVQITLYILIFKYSWSPFQVGTIINPLYWLENWDTKKLRLRKLADAVLDLQCVWNWCWGIKVAWEREYKCQVLLETSLALWCWAGHSLPFWASDVSPVK